MVDITNCLYFQGNAIKFQVAACSTSLVPEDMLPISFCQVKDVEGAWEEDCSWPDLDKARRP